MKMFRYSAAMAAMLGFAAAGAAVAAPAPPAGPQVMLDANYAYNDFSGVHANEYGGAVGAEFPLGTSDWSVQLDGGGHGISSTGGGGSFSQWSVDGAATWNHQMGRIGAAVAYDGIDFGGGLNASFVTYGVYGDWFAGPNFTVGAKAGGITESGGGFGSSTQAYVGGHAVVYPMPNLALSGSVDYIGGGNAIGQVTTAGARIEYMFSQTTPFSLYGGYDYVDLAGFHDNVFSVGVRYRFGASGATLVDRQRTGVDDWGPAMTSLRFAF